MKAKTLNGVDVRRLLTYVAARDGPRGTVMVLLSFRAGLRACEIAGLTWTMVTDGHGKVGHHAELSADISKYGSARRLPLHPELRRALVRLARQVGQPEGPVIVSQRGGHMRAKAVVNWFTALYRSAGLRGCSSHSGRRTFVTQGARLLAKSGGSLRDLQQLVGHRSINTTQRYIDGDSDAQRRLIRLL
jgi:integrase